MGARHAELPNQVSPGTLLLNYIYIPGRPGVETDIIKAAAVGGRLCMRLSQVRLSGALALLP